MTFVNTYLLVLPAGSTIATPDLSHDRVARSLQLDDASWALASGLGTAAAVGEALGLSGADDRQQRGWASHMRADEDRLTAIETELRRRPTKADLEGLKNRMPLRLAGLIPLGVVVITLIQKLLPQ